MDYDLIVIGSGPAGYHAAIKAASFYKKNVLLIEKHQLGGTCLNAGCIPAKTWLNAAHSYQKTQTNKTVGFSCDVQANFQFEQLQEHKNALVESLRQSMMQQLNNCGIIYKKGNAQLIDNHRVKIENELYSATFILLATGSYPKTEFPFLKTHTNLEAVCTPEQLFDSNSLPASISIIGGGINGVEFADFYASLGCRVYLIETKSTLLDGLDHDIVKRFTMQLKRKGISIYLSAKVHAISGNCLEIDTQTVNGTERIQLHSDRILLTAGRIPNFNAEFSPYLYTDNATDKLTFGVQAISQSIYAAGDVTGENMFAHIAEYQGIKCVDLMFGNHQNEHSIPVFPIVVYTYPELASVGLTEENARQQGLAYKVVLQPMGISGRYLIEYPNEIGLVKIIFSQDGYILGIHMLGGQCSEIITFATMLVQRKIHVRDIEDIIFPHPVISEVLKYAFRKFYS